MSFRSFFNARKKGEVRIVKGEAGKPDREVAGNNQSTFVTPETLVSFPVATAFIFGVWKVLQFAGPEVSGFKSAWIPISLSLVWGVILIVMDLTDPKSKLTARDKFIRVVIGLVNSVVLMTAVLGIRTVLS